METENKETRFYRGLILLALRDLNGAAADFNGSDDRKRAADALEKVHILRGEKPAQGLTAFMHNIPTDFGWIPIEFASAASSSARIEATRDRENLARPCMAPPCEHSRQSDGHFMCRWGKVKLGEVSTNSSDRPASPNHSNNESDYESKDQANPLVRI